MSSPLLTVESLETRFTTEEGLVRAVNGASFTIAEGETVCIVGESGSGKSITARSLLRLLARNGRIVGGNIRFQARDGSSVDITTLDPKGRQMRSIRGGEIAMIFQEPMSALSPVHTIGEQVAEGARLHLGMNKTDAYEEAVRVLDRVGIPRPRDRMSAYPFQLSGGMRQRVCIAMALACRPRLLIADEPTTALDVTTQATILDLLKDLQAEQGMAMLFITHDLGVVSEIADRIVVMYLGEVMEQGPARDVLERPTHPYTQGLLECLPALGWDSGERLNSIPGLVPHPQRRPVGCVFNPRCGKRIGAVCETVHPTLFPAGATQVAACHLWATPAELPKETSHG
ncbi:MAG TPA: ABC transporter ATP-binding protein [Devosia sp.]|nr:ABC transporter ATP-binding protein [Devosia sp.]